MYSILYSAYTAQYWLHRLGNDIVRELLLADLLWGDTNEQNRVASLFSEDELTLQRFKTWAITDSQELKQKMKEPAPSSAQQRRSKQSRERANTLRAQEVRIHTFEETQTALEHKKILQLGKGKQMYLSSSESWKVITLKVSTQDKR